MCTINHWSVTGLGKSFDENWLQSMNVPSFIIWGNLWYRIWNLTVMTEKTWQYVDQKSVIRVSVQLRENGIRLII